ncbi:MAG TPA: hypothetical protein VGV89_01815 [Thermoplasmata archaeon]|nr:hypothetical protein [Thermoplasmata archaeon]
MPAEYVVLKAVHPTYLNLQMPTEVGEVIQYDPAELRELHAPARGIAFLTRGAGVVRVVPSFRAGALLPLETVRNRYLATAHLSDKLVFNLPEAVVLHLGLKVQTRSPRDTRFTDDGLVWFLPAPEYYEYRARQRSGKGWHGPTSGVLAHVYLARSVIPWASELEEIERRIDAEEWRPQLESPGRTSRWRKASAG